MRSLKRILALALCLCALLPAAFAAAEGNEELLKTFVLRYGDRESKKIAITVDDCYKSATEWIKRDAELCREYGIAMTFFPLVNTGCLEEKYRDLWQEVVDSGCEIGTHTNYHVKMGNRDAWSIIGGLGKSQEALDKTLGYHYEISGNTGSSISFTGKSARQKTWKRHWKRRRTAASCCSTARKRIRCSWKS